jgi:hypothetical protein
MGPPQITCPAVVLFASLNLVPGIAALPIAAAGNSMFHVCYDFECATRQPVSLTDAEWQEIRRLFIPMSSSPGAERRRIRKAIALFETQVGRYTGTTADIGKNSTGNGKPGQMDCIDESTNTTTYLALLQNAGLLRWHTVGERIMRRRWVFGQHWGATIMDTTDGLRYVVDSWHLDNGKPPFIQELADWLDNKSFDD